MFIQKCANLSLRKTHCSSYFRSQQVYVKQIIEDFLAQILDFVIFKVNSLVIAHTNNYKFIIYSLGFCHNRFIVNFSNFTYFYTFIVFCNFTTFGK